MKYIGQFADVKGKKHEITVVTEGKESPARNVTLSADPFKTEMSDSKNLYAPSRLSTATVEFIQDNGKDFMTDLYSGKAHGTRVMLVGEDENGTRSITVNGVTKKARVEWIGYATPVTYDGDYKGQRDTVPLECTDGVATLKYLKYRRTGKIISFRDLTRNILRRCDCYRYFYFSAATHIDGYNSCIIDDTYISEQNFFGSKDDKNQVDDDVAWDCLDVIEEICRYFNVCVTTWGEDVYFIDYDAIRGGVNTYYRYAIGDDSEGVKVTLASTVTVDGSMYRSAGGTLSLDDVYNRIKVKSSFYNYTNLIPDVFGFAINITKDSDPSKSAKTTVDAEGMGAVIYSSLQTYGEKKKNMEVLFIAPGRTAYAVFVKYYKSPYFKTHRYTWNGTKLVESNLEEVNFTDTQNTYGAYIVRTCTVKLGQDIILTPWWETAIKQGKTQAEIIQAALELSNTSSINLEERILLCNPSPHHITNGALTNYPFFESEAVEGLGLAGGKNVYILISGSYRYQKYDAPFVSEGDENLGHGRYSADVEDCHLVARLKWGKLYWSGDITQGDNGWIEKECTFNIPYARSGDNTRADNMMWKDVQFTNSVRWDSGLDDEGYMAPLPDSTLISGVPVITLYKPYDPNYHSSKSGDNEGQYYKHNQVSLKDFKIRLVKADPSREGDADTDTIYTNIISNGNVQDFDAEEMRITTDDNKNPSYSSVAVKNDAGYVWLGDTVNDATLAAEKEWAVEDGDADVSTSGDMRQEQHRVFRHVNQYSAPAVKIAFTARNIVKPWSLIVEPYIGKNLILDGQNINFRQGTSELATREMR